MAEHPKRIAAFLFGIVAHSLSDLSWHSLRGLQAGFIRVQAAAGFAGDYATSHLLADEGGDYVLRHMQALDHLISPFVTEQIENYPMGGFYDMTVWTLECWNGLAGYLNKDPANLTSPETLFHLCDELMEGKTSKPTEVPQFSSDSQVEKEKSHAHTGIASGHQSVNENLQRRGEEILQPGMDDLNKAGLTVQTNTDPATGMVTFSIQELQNHDNPTATVTPGVEPMVARRRSDVLTNKVNTICEHFMDDAERTGCFGSGRFLGLSGPMVSKSRLGSQILFEDFDHDGKADLVVTSWHDSQYATQAGTVAVKFGV
ncbi:integrin subunit alpha 8 [Mortierella alpina]|nr:integrin subunit alpha 8 [Mortierella alpina]